MVLNKADALFLIHQKPLIVRSALNGIGKLEAMLCVLLRYCRAGVLPAPSTPVLTRLTDILDNGESCVLLSHHFCIQRKNSDGKHVVNSL